MLRVCDELPALDITRIVVVLGELSTFKTTCGKDVWRATNAYHHPCYGCAVSSQRLNSPVLRVGWELLTLTTTSVQGGWWVASVSRMLLRTSGERPTLNMNDGKGVW